VLRPWRREDLESLVRHADNPNVARGLRDRFPNPYTRAAGEWFLDDAQKPHGEWRLAIDGRWRGRRRRRAAPRPGRASDQRRVGYWLGEAYWAAASLSVPCVTTVVPHAMQRFDLCRVSVRRLPRHTCAPCAALEKAGFERVGARIRCGVRPSSTADCSIW
jgi:hypothetical protein